MTRYLNALRKNVDGATAIEYGLIAALIGIAIITSFSSLGQTFVEEPMQAVIDGIADVSS